MDVKITVVCPGPVVSKGAENSIMDSTEKVFQCKLTSFVCLIVDAMLTFISCLSACK